MWRRKLRLCLCRLYSCVCVCVCVCMYVYTDDHMCQWRSFDIPSHWCATLQGIQVRESLAFRGKSFFLRCWQHGKLTCGTWETSLSTTRGLPWPSMPFSKKNLPTMQETWVWSLGWEDPGRMATHSSILAWRIPWTDELAGLQSVGLQRIGHNWATNNKGERQWEPSRALWKHDVPSLLESFLLGPIILERNDLCLWTCWVGGWRGVDEFEDPFSKKTSSFYS